MKRTLLQAALAAAFCTLGTAQAAVAKKPSTLADQQSVAVTIDNENLAPMIAPVASGWSISPGEGAYTRWKAPPFHGAHPIRSFA